MVDAYVRGPARRDIDEGYTGTCTVRLGAAVVTLKGFVLVAIT